MQWRFLHQQRQRRHFVLHSTRVHHRRHKLVRRVLGHVRRRILGRLSLQKLVGILVDRVNNVSGRYRGVVDGGQLWQLDCVPFGLRFEELSRTLAPPSVYHRGETRTSCAREVCTSPFLRFSFLSFLTLTRFLSGGGFVKPSLVSAWVRFFPI